MRWSKPSLFILALLGLAGTNLGGGEMRVPTPENLESREWFQNARFGLFIHWGVYSVEGRGEWLMHKDTIVVLTLD